MATRSRLAAGCVIRIPFRGLRSETINAPLIHQPLIYQPPALSGRWNTPTLLRDALYAACVGALLLFLTIAYAVSQRQTAFKTVAQDSAPSILAAQHIHAYLADMDANAANELIALPGQNMDAVRDYSKRGADGMDSLVSAAQNITYGDQERVPILTLANGIAQYERAMTQARDFHERGDPAMLAAYRRADDILHKTLFPAVDALDKVNNDALTRAYSGDRTGFTLSLLLTGVIGALALAVLIATQLFLSRRVRRTLNPPFLAATILMGGYLLHTLAVFAGVGSDFKIAKEDAFDSIRALWQTRALAYDANAYESRWLLDRPLAPTYEKAFRDKLAAIAAVPAGQDMGSVAQTYTQGHKAEGFKGKLADELNNVTFSGEMEAATATLRNWGQYVAIDSKIRQLESSGQHDKAVALCIGNDPGESNYAYTQFDDALTKTLALNQKEFDVNVKDAGDKLAPYSKLNPIMLLLVVALTFAGLMPRLREYAF